MAGSGKERLPYEITRSGLLAVGTAFIISLCLVWYMAMAISEPGCKVFLAILVGSSFMGGTLGAAIGQAFRDERGGAAAMGAFIGALAGPPIALILLVELLFFIWTWHGCP